MEGFKRGFYTTYKKLERKPESNIGQSSFPQPQPFSQFQQPGEEQKQVQKTVHATTPTSQEKPRKQMKSALHQEVSDFNPSSQMSMEQLIKVVLNLQEELMENLSKQEEIESRLMSQERDLNAFQSISQDQSNQSQSQQYKQTEIGNRIEKIEENQLKLQLQMEIREHKSDPIQIEQEIIRKPQKNRSKQRLEKMLLLWKLMIFITEIQEILAEKTELLDPRKEKKEPRRSKTKPNVLQSKWRVFQNQERCDMTRTGKERKVDLEKTEFPISLKLEVPNIFIQQLGA